MNELVSGQDGGRTFGFSDHGRRTGQPVYGRQFPEEASGFQGAIGNNFPGGSEIENVGVAIENKIDVLVIPPPLDDLFPGRIVLKSAGVMDVLKGFVR